MKNTIKIVLSLIICIITLLSLGMTVLGAAPENDTIMPLYDNITRAVVNITFSNGTGTAIATVKRASGTNSMSGILEVYNSNGVLVASGTNQTTRATLVISVSFNATIGQTYTAILSATAIKSNVEESINESFTSTYIS